MAERTLVDRRPRFLLAALGCVLFTLAVSAQQALTPAVYQSLPFRYIGLPGNRVNAVAGVAGDPDVCRGLRYADADAFARHVAFLAEIVVPAIRSAAPRR